MEVPGFLENVVAIYLLPLAAFALGAEIFVQLDLHAASGLTRRQVYMMSIPVGLVLCGWLLTTSSISTTQLVDSQVLPGGRIGSQQITLIKYGFTESIERYFIFIGVLIFYGTLTPELFVTIRIKLSRENPTAPIERR